MFADSITRRFGNPEGFSAWQQSRLAVLALAGATLLSGCGLDTNTPLAPPPPPPVYIANIGGLVGSTADGSAVSGATVSIGDPAGAAASGLATGATGANAETTTNSGGAFLLGDVPASTRTVVHVSKPGFVDGYPVTSTLLGFTTSVAAQLVPIANSSSVAMSSGGTVTVSGSTAAAVIPANSLQTAGGTPASGNVTVAVTPVAPAQTPEAMPGDYSAATAPIESFGAIAVTAQDASGANLGLIAGQTITVSIPYNTRNTDPPPTTITLFRFDPTTGYWVPSAATATLTGTAPNQFYQGAIDQPGIWTAGQQIATTATITGCVVTDDTFSPVPNVRITAQGISYSGESTAITDAHGNFTMRVKASSSVIVSGQIGEFLTNTLSNTNGGPLNSCLSLSMIAGAPRITLSWGATPGDLDSHLIAPDGTHVYYGSPGSLSTAPFMKLDVDDTTSFGPEVVTISHLMIGTYTYSVRNFPNLVTGTMVGSPARVEFRQGGQLRVFSPVGGGETASTDWWTVFQFNVDAHCNITVTPINVFTTAGDTGPGSPTIPAPVAQQFCTP